MGNGGGLPRPFLLKSRLHLSPNASGHGYDSLSLLSRGLLPPVRSAPSLQRPGRPLPAVPDGRNCQPDRRRALPLTRARGPGAGGVHGPPRFMGL
ncbi:MAG: hypothetical protein RLZZ244_281 [Verrucomicrobiota bacterium]